MHEVSEVMPLSLDGDKLGAAQALFFKNHGTFLNEILTSSPDLFIQDGETILENLEGHLPEYTGSCDDAAFVAWAIESSRPDVEKYKFFYELRKQYHGNVLGGIRAVPWTFPTIKTTWDKWPMTWPILSGSGPSST